MCTYFIYIFLDLNNETGNEFSIVDVKINDFQNPSDSYK